MNLKTRITTLLNIQYPIISAPMAGISGGKLATAVSHAGGLGMVGVGYADADWLIQQFNIAKDIPIGVGFITWQLDKKNELLELALEKKPKAIMLSFGDPAPYVETIKSKGIKLICQIQSVTDAKYAAAIGADIVIAQGCEAGGHIGSRSTFPLVPAVVDAIAPIPVIAAGGIADGRGLAAALMLGAEGVLIGTRFYACEESLGHQNAKQKIVEATGDQTINSRLFDEVRDLVWPAPFTARALKNKLFPKIKMIDEHIKTEYQTALKHNDFSIAPVFASEAVDLIHKVLSAEQIMQNLVKEAEQALSGTTR